MKRKSENYKNIESNIADNMKSANNAEKRFKEPVYCMKSRKRSGGKNE